METEQKKHRFTVRRKMNIFVILIILVVAVGTSTITFITSINQIDSYYRQIASDNAKNFASMVDGDYLGVLRKAIESEEYQAIREKAEAEEDEAAIEEYLKKEGLWEQYIDIRTRLTSYISNIENLEYLYVVAHGDADATLDMYLIDDERTELYETGYYEEREEAFLGKDLEHQQEPQISKGDWGWLCSAFYPVYDSAGTCVCIVGCDFLMDEVMQERWVHLIYLAIGTLAITLIVVLISVFFINKTVAKPLNAITSEMRKFDPSKYKSYAEAGVIDLDIKSNDEIGQIYQELHLMQTDIVDYMNNLNALQEDKLKAEKQIGELSKETLRDALTHVGNKAGYIKKADEINESIKSGEFDFAVVMVDMNNLKHINDDYGHRAGDTYIKGCCHMICDVFKRSPVYRIGGDEFAAILYGQDYDNRKELVEKLKEDFKTTFSQTDVDPWLRYSAAVGIAERSFDDASFELVFKRADKAMYDDKAEFKKQYGGYR